MGAKQIPNLRRAHPTCKCKICGRGFISVQALRSHNSFAHPKTRQRVAYKPNTEVIAERVLMTSKLRKVAPKIPVQKKNIVKEDQKEKDNDEKDPKKIEFECPKCAKLYSAYFHAVKHIQKYHCVSADGKAVSPNSPDLIKPIRTEICSSCNLRVGTMHVCNVLEQYTQHTSSSCKCIGCKKDFGRLSQFDLHITAIHSKEGQTLFFPLVSEYNSWKEHMESQTQSSYMKMSETHVKQIHRCLHFIPNFDGDKTGLCPSSLIVQEFPNGTQVHFYKEHYGHICKPYSLDDEYKKYMINHIMEHKDILSPKLVKSEDTETYLEFKKLMENIVLEASKLNVASLQPLLDKALEMNVLLNNHEDGKRLDTPKNMTDDEISQVLQEVKTRSKRKLEIKQEKSVSNDTPMKKQKNVENENASKKISNITKSPSNFNDSFKDFVGSINCKVEQTPVKKKKEIMKTKIGQFKPNSPKKKKDEEKSVRFDVNDQSISNEICNDSFDSEPIYQRLRISDFKFDPKTIKDIKYEVKEQENDCNILILKI